MTQVQGLRSALDLIGRAIDDGAAARVAVNVPGSSLALLLEHGPGTACAVIVRERRPDHADLFSEWRFFSGQWPHVRVRLTRAFGARR